TTLQVPRIAVRFRSASWTAGTPGRAALHTTRVGSVQVLMPHQPFPHGQQGLVCGSPRISPCRASPATSLTPGALYAPQGRQGTCTTTSLFGCLPTDTRATSCRFATSRIETSSPSTLLTQQYLPSGLKVTQVGPLPTPTLPTSFLVEAAITPNTASSSRVFALPPHIAPNRRTCGVSPPWSASRRRHPHGPGRAVVEHGGETLVEQTTLRPPRPDSPLGFPSARRRAEEPRPHSTLRHQPRTTRAFRSFRPPPGGTHHRPGPSVCRVV